VRADVDFRHTWQSALHTALPDGDFKRAASRNLRQNALSRLALTKTLEKFVLQSQENRSGS